MPAHTCPKDEKGNIICANSFLQSTCISLFKGHSQDCTDERVAGGWFTCVEVKRACDVTNYWINKDEVWVRDGCGGEIQACYTKDIPRTNLRSRVIECRNWNTDYKECQIDGAALVDSIELRGELTFNDNAKCTKGLNYGIYKNTVWIKDGCNGHFSVDFYPDVTEPIPMKTPSPPFPTSRPSTIKPETLRPTRIPHNATFSTSASSTTAVQVTAPPPGKIWTDGLMGVTIGVLCGAFLMLLLTFLGVLWFARRRRYLDKEKKTESASFRREDPYRASFMDDDRQYEEIHPRESLHYESTPFIGQTAPKPLVANRTPEPNNNPTNHLGENYFILEPSGPPCAVHHHIHGRPPVIPPEHLIPLRQKYIISNQHPNPSEMLPTSMDTCSRVSSACRSTDGQSPICRSSDGHSPVCRGSDGHSPVCRGSGGHSPVCRGIDGQSPVCRSTDGQSPVCRNTNGHNTIGHLQRHSPHAFYPVCNHPGQFSLDRRSKCNVDRTASVSSQTDSGLEYQFESDDEGYDKIEKFRESLKIPSKSICPHSYDEVVMDDSSDEYINDRQGEFSSFKRSDRSSC